MFMKKKVLYNFDYKYIFQTLNNTSMLFLL